MATVGRAYLDRLQLALDVRLIDDPTRWPELATRADRIAEAVRATRSTRARGVDELSREERLLHAVARALGGQLDRDAAQHIHDEPEQDRDVVFVAIVLASQGYETERAQAVYTLALGERLAPALDDSLRQAFERGFPPGHADRLRPRLQEEVLRRWPTSRWARLVRALAGDDAALADAALDAPHLLTSALDRVAEALLEGERWREHLARLALDDAQPLAARLTLLAHTAGWRFPLPSAPVGAAIARAGMVDPHGSTLLALAIGDGAGAARLARATPASTDPAAWLARGLALLGGTIDDVRGLWQSSPVLAAPASPFEALHPALFAIELGDRALAAMLVRSVVAYADHAWGRRLLARLYLTAGEHGAVEDVLAEETDAVARLLRARALAYRDRSGALARLRVLVAEYPGWSEARLRLGLVLAMDPADRERALEVLDTFPRRDAAETGVLGPATTARAAALLAAGELYRQAGRHELALRRVHDALDLAPGSLLVARQAAILAVALREGGVAAQAQGRLRSIAPGAAVVERLAGAVAELTDRRGMAAHYERAGAWDRVLVLAARAGTPVELPDTVELHDASVAALHAVAVAAAATGDLRRAGDALEAAVARRPDHGGLREDLVAVRLREAHDAIVADDPDAMIDAASALERAASLVDDPRLGDARTRTMLATSAHWAARGELGRAQAWFDELASDAPLARLHGAALAIAQSDTVHARHLLDGLTDEHATLLAGVAAYLDEHDADVRDAVARLAGARSPRVRAARRLLDIWLRGGEPQELVAWLRDPADGPLELGADAVLHVAAALHFVDEPGISQPELAQLLERAAERCDARDGARRLRLSALLLRARGPEQAPIDLAALAPERMERDDERELAIALVAVEARRRRALADPGANEAVGLLVTLTEHSDAVGLLALASMDQAADLALELWNEHPAHVLDLQTALATALRVAYARETTGASHDACCAAWERVVGLLGPVLVEDRFWRDLASAREAVYRVPPTEHGAARAACARRVADLFVALAKANPAASTRIDHVRGLLSAELAVARSLDRIGNEAPELASELPLACGPLGLDLLELRASVIADLAHVTPGSELAMIANDVRGILEGQLVEGWTALHDGRVEAAEQVARGRIARWGRVDPDTTRLLAALYIRRIREAMDDDDVHRAGEVIGEWVTKERAPELPEELAGEIAVVVREIYRRYGLGPARRKLGQVRDKHDTATIREEEAALIAAHLQRRSGGDPGERVRLYLDALALGGDASLRDDLEIEVSALLASTRELPAIDALIAVLATAAMQPTNVLGAMIAAQVRKSEVADQRLVRPTALEARIEELRRLLDQGRAAGVSVRELLYRLARLHEQLQHIYANGGNLAEAGRHEHRAAAYRNWTASEDDPA